jgi:hypothetical protein
MRKLRLGAFVVLATACGSDGGDAVSPDGNWDLTMTFGTGNCMGLPTTFAIGFNVTTNDCGAVTFTPGTGLTGDNLSVCTTCTTTKCELTFQDSGPGTEGSDVITQTITATLDEDASGTVKTNDAATNQVVFTLTEASSCTQAFSGAGRVSD